MPANHVMQYLSLTLHAFMDGDLLNFMNIFRFLMINTVLFYLSDILDLKILNFILFL